VNKILGLATEGKPIRAIARELQHSRNTVRKYLRGAPPPAARSRRRSKLDPYKEQIMAWLREDHLYNCETMLERLQAQGYRGSITILKDFVQPFRLGTAGHQPVVRYETGPGEQLQFDWGEFVYEREGTTHKLYGFSAVLGYSRMRFVQFSKRCDTPTLIRGLMRACEYFGGLPKVALTDRMKSVLVDMDGQTPVWNPRFADFAASVGLSIRVCKPYTPQTKGKIERTIGVVKRSFWPGAHFGDLDDLNRQALAWCERRNGRVHRTTRRRPCDLLAAEQLHPLPAAFAWERFATEERRVSWDGYLSFDGVLYGLPSAAAAAGSTVQVRDHGAHLSIWQRGECLVQVPKQARSGEIVTHPEQFRDVLPAASLRRQQQPLAHQLPAPTIVQRPTAAYDALYGVEGWR
jgi:transposase